MFDGPSYTAGQCIEACKSHQDKPLWQLLDAPYEKAAQILARGHLLAWFKGRMEFGTRALGNRSILANQNYPEVVEKINHQVKFSGRHMAKESAELLKFFFQLRRC